MEERQRLQDALDDCLRDIEEGRATSQDGLSEFEEWADELEPLLDVAAQLREAPRPTASSTAFAAGLDKMLAVASEERRPTESHAGPWERLLAWWQQALSLRLVLTAATALVVLALGGLLLPAWLNAPVGRAATLTRVAGAVEVLPVGGGPWTVVSVGDEVRSGDRLRTAAFSAATLTFFDGSTTEVEPGTEISLAEVTSRRRGGGTVIVIYQWIGQTHTRVRPLSDTASRFAIETLTAVAAVRGTEFFISVERDGSTTVRVAEGLVDVVGEGFYTQVSPGEEISVYPVEPRLCVTVTPTPVLESPPAAEATPTPERDEVEASPTPTYAPTATPSPTPTPTVPPPTLEPTVTPLPTDTPLPPPTSVPQPPPPPTSTPLPPPTNTPAPPPPTPTHEGPPSPSP